MKSIKYTGPERYGEKSYSDRCGKAPLPEGYRFLKLGETIKESDCVLSYGRGPWEPDTTQVGKVVRDIQFPFIREVVKRGPKGQFISTKPAPKVELSVDTKADIATNSLSLNKIRLENTIKALGGAASGLNYSHLWSKTDQGHEYWHSRAKGETPLSASDKAFLELLKSTYELEIAKQTPKPKETLNKEMAEWIGRLTDIERLKERITNIKAAIAGTNIKGVYDFVWAHSKQRIADRSYEWGARMSGDTPISDSDREYMKLIVEAMEARLKELAPPKTEVDTLKERIAALEKENADLKAWKSKILDVVR